MTEAELKALVERTRHFIEAVVIPAESPEHVQDGGWIDIKGKELQREARRLGLYGPQLSRELGGLGLSWHECCPIFEQAGRSYLGPVALNCSAPGQPDIALLDHLASAEQRRDYLLPLAEGRRRSCFAMTEPAPGVGSDPRMLTASARRTQSGWELSGHKWMITGARVADFAIVMARAENGPSLFLVDTNTPGFRFVRDVPTMEPFESGGHGEIKLEACHIPAAAMLGEEGKGLDYAQFRLEGARLFHCMRFIGMVTRATEIALDYIRRRQSFGAPLAEHQLVLAMVADSEVDLYACRLMTSDVARRLDRGASIRHTSSLAKVFVAEAVNRIADRAVQMTGALGISEDTLLSMILRQVRPFRIYDGASEVHRAAIGRRVVSRGPSGWLD